MGGGHTGHWELRHWAPRHAPLTDRDVCIKELVKDVGLYTAKIIPGNFNLRIFAHETASRSDMIFADKDNFTSTYNVCLNACLAKCLVGRKVSLSPCSGWCPAAVRHLDLIMMVYGSL